MLVLLLPGCFFGQEPDTIFPCDYTAEQAGWDQEVLGTTASALLADWEGAHHYIAVGVPDSSRPAPADWMTGWTVTLESSGPPSVRESFDCAPHLSVPVRWTLALDNRAISQQGDGATVQESPFNHGELRALGPERSDQRLRLNTLEDAGEAGEAFYWSYPEFKRNQAPTLSLSGTGDVAELYGSYRHSETLIASFRLQGVREPTP